MNKATEQFINKAISMHGNKYDYSKIEYINSRTKIKILCNCCRNYFYQRPSDHLRRPNYKQKQNGKKYIYKNNGGCPKCSNKNKKTTEQFIEQAKIKHGYKYDYSQTDYKNYKTKIKVICNQCRTASFVFPKEHLNAKGKCKVCNKISRKTIQEEMLRERKINRLAQFIKKAISKHGNKYDYSNVLYNASNVKVEIYCRKCKTFFQQTMSNHISCSGCPKCNSHTKTKKEFIKEAKILHGNKYNYSKSQYVNLGTKTEIICNNCNKPFWQSPSAHLIGRGCECYGRLKIRLKDGTMCDSMVEAYYYLLFKNKGISFKYHQLYGAELGQRLYDFYIEDDNKYIEITGYNRGNYKYVTNKHWIGYLRNIVIKKRYVEKIGAKFEFIQAKKLSRPQLRFVHDNIQNTTNQST